MMHPFAHLRVHSDYSLGRGASKVKTLVKKAAALRQPAMALVDESNLYGSMEFAKEASGCGLQAVAGTSVQFVLNKDATRSGTVILLAQTPLGYANVCRVLNLVLQPGRKFTNFLDHQVLTQVVEAKQAGVDPLEDVICLAGAGGGGLVGEMISTSGEASTGEFLDFLAYLFPGRLYVEICRNGHPSPDDVKAEESTLRLALQRELPIVATSDVWYVEEADHDTFEILAAVSRGEQGALAAGSAGLEGIHPRRFHLRSSEEMAALFSDLPEAFENASEVARRCAFAPGGRSPILPPFPSERGLSEADEMRSQATDGLAARLDAKGVPEHERGPYEERLAYELDVIEKMKFPGYFLIVSDFIKWAKREGIPVGPGRGSGAGSVVAWSLFITDLDPLQFDLLFERFLNPDRVSMPDFDVDFCQDGRERVIAYVKDKYGSDKVAAIPTFTGLKSKSAFKDAGRVVRHVTEGGLSPKEMNGITGLIPPDKDKPADPAKLAVAYDTAPEFRSRIDESDRTKVVFQAAKRLEGLYRNSSLHAAGIIIGGDSLTSLVPVGFDPKTGMSVVQFNMKDAENAGLVKFDFLGLKTLSVIRLALEYVRETNGIDIDIDTIPLDDAPTLKMLAAGFGTAVFQFESEGMKRVLRDMSPDRLEDLIAAVSLYRPGPMGMIPVYCDVRHGRLPPDYPEPRDKTAPILEATYGIMVYQEQVMAIARAVAGYTLGQADLLRRAMGKKIKAEMDAQKATFIDGSVANGVRAKDASDLFDKIAKFAEYGFNKSHAAAYALISYQTAWLKKHYPVEFLSAFLAYVDGNGPAMALVKQDLDAFGIEMLPPCVQKSRVRFAPERRADGTLAVRFGLISVKGISATVEAMVAEREANGAFPDLLSFHERVGKHFNTGQVTQLASAGAFDAIEKVRRRANDTLVYLLKNDKGDKGLDLFGGTNRAVVPSEISNVSEWTNPDQMEFDVLGFFIKQHPLDRNIEAMRVNQVKRRLSIVQHMQDKGLADITQKKLMGLVETVKVEQTRRGMPYLRIMLAEKEDKYWVSYFPPPGSDVIEPQKKLDKYRLDRKPVIFESRFYRRDGGDFGISSEHFMSDDEFLAAYGSRSTKTIWIDPREHDAHRPRIRELESAAKASGSDGDRTALRDYLLKVTDDIVNELCDLVSGTTPDDNGDAFEIMMTLDDGTATVTSSYAPFKDSRFLFDDATNLMLQGAPGATSNLRMHAAA